MVAGQVVNLGSRSSLATKTTHGQRDLEYVQLLAHPPKGEFMGYWGFLHPAGSLSLLEAGALHLHVFHHPEWIHAVRIQGQRKQFRLQLVPGFQKGPGKHGDEV